MNDFSQSNIFFFALPVLQNNLLSIVIIRIPKCNNDFVIHNIPALLVIVCGRIAQETLTWFNIKHNTIIYIR